ncbi:MAG TPA: hypothetical protein VGP07_03245 [Polyangia bacterium]
MSLGVFACNGGGGQGGVVIVVDGQGLTQAQLDSVAYVWIFIDGDGARVTQGFPMTGLKGGMYKSTYHPVKHSGVLTITGELDDRSMVPIATSSTTVDVKMGNQVMATIMLTGTIPIGTDGGMDAATACAAALCDALVPDGCCPVGCTTATDLDCAVCGDGAIEPGETCDPLATCPTACPQNGCQLLSLTKAGTCQAACAPAGVQSLCVNGDGCCPTGCTSGTDTDCAPICGNKVLDGAETCDGDCPVACPALGCQLRTLTGSAATCDARCVNGALQTVCVTGDGCCPSGCTTATDADCAVACGNGMLDAGETCDGNCATTCPAMGCQLRTLTGSAATCNAQCVNGAMQTACVNKDGCCPTGCNTSNDSDCVAGCGNGVIEAGETCEVAPASPLCSAITCDDKNACTTDTRLGLDATCTVACAHSTISACGGATAPKDGCCAPGCDATNDADCAVVCGNGVVEAPTEACDTKLEGSCPTTCPQAACVLPDLVNAGTCKAACVDQGRRQTACVLAAKDGCCPGGCNATNDADCPVVCGNGVIETGETCETMAPATKLCAALSCDDGDACTTDVKTGANATCNVACGHTAVTACSLTKDGCCPANCNMTNDADCGAVCGNGVLETGETCETKAPATPLCTAVSCNDGDVCTTDAMTGSATTCNLKCTNTKIVACSGAGVKDGCCAPGCNATNDGDCAAVCGNGLIESGETCDVAPAATQCPNANSCVSAACTKATLSGSAANCTALCTKTTINTCIDGDGCCAAGCTSANDNDCVPANDTCAGATDISAGGDFPFSLFNAQLDLGTVNNTKCGFGGQPEVFFTFTLPTNPAGTAPPLYYGYFDVYDPAGKVVNAGLELYQGSCTSINAGNPTDCGQPTSGNTACGTAAGWPRLMPVNNLTGGLQYILVARQVNSIAGRYTLRFHRIPASCVAGGALPATATPTTCNSADLYGNTCTAVPMAGAVNYYVEKCPAPGLTVDTCGGRAAALDTVIQVSRGSVDFTGGKCVVASTVMQVCNDTAASCAAGPKDATVTNSERGERGLFTVVVGSVDKCSNVTLTSSLVP